MNSIVKVIDDGFLKTPDAVPALHFLSLWCTINMFCFSEVVHLACELLAKPSKIRFVMRASIDEFESKFSVLPSDIGRLNGGRIVVFDFTCFLKSFAEKQSSGVSAECPKI